MLAEFEISSDIFDAPRKIWIQPPMSGRPADCLIFLDAEIYIDRLKAPTIVANLQEAGTLPPVTSIYLSHVDVMTRGRDFTCNGAFASFLATGLRRWIEEKAGLFERTFICGLSLSALAAVFTTLQHPDVFDGVVAQSPSAWWDDERLTRSLTPGNANTIRVWISVGDQETDENVLHSPVGLFQTTSQRDSVRHLAEKMAGQCQDLRLNEFSGGHDTVCWADELPHALQWLMAKA